MKWFQISINKLRKMSAEPSDTEKLEDALDFKYGNYDYSKDARLLNEDEFNKTFLKIINDNLVTPKSDTKVLVTGANSGYELDLLKDFQVTALDLSEKAIKKIDKAFKAVHGNIEQLPFDDNSFDIYISMRSIHSSNIDIEKALDESLRVTTKNALLVYSVSNAYVVDGKLVKGVYIPSKEQFDETIPYTLVSKIKSFLEEKNLKIDIIDIPSEIIIVAKKHE